MANTEENDTTPAPEPKATQIRERLHRLITDELLGPQNGPTEEVAETRVSDRYLVGMLSRRSWGHVHLDGPNPHVELPASITKSGQAEQVPLIPALVEALRARKGEDGAPVFPTLPRVYTLHKDLEKAGIAAVDGRGREVVLHSFRHSLATMLAAYGVPMVLAQQIMRHRDIRLTAQVYTDEALLPLAAAMRALPVPSCATSMSMTRSATGVHRRPRENRPAVPGSVPDCAQNVAPGRRAGANAGKSKSTQPLLVAGVGNSRQEGVEWAQQDSNL